jgi:hypothetical protein
LGFIEVVAEFARQAESDGPIKEVGFPPKTAPKAS